VVEPLTTASLVALAKKDGVHAATTAYKYLARKDAAQRLGKKGLRGLPRPRRALVRALRRKDSTLLEALIAAAAVVNVNDQDQAPRALSEAVDRELGRARPR
jgi:hypothetical protein